MNISEWIRDLPSHVLEALRSIGWGREGFSYVRLFLSLLLLLSGLATGLGLLSLVRANNAGQVGLVEGFLVVVLAIGAVVTMWIALEQAMVAMTLKARAACWLVYIFFALWSIGFGFGFYWNRLASMDVAKDQIGVTVATVSKQLSAAGGRIDGIRDDIRAAEEMALVSMKQERDVGGTCAGSSGRGGGDLCKARFGMTQAIHGEASGLLRWSGGGGPLPDLGAVSCNNPDAPAPKVDFGTTQLQTDLKNLQTQAESIQRAAGTLSHDQLAQQYSDYSTRASGILSGVDAILGGAKEKAPALRELETRIRNGFPMGGQVCSDVNLANKVKELAGTLQRTEPLNLRLPDLNVGEKATKAAFMRLYDNAFQVPGMLIGRGNRAAEPLDKRDFIALIAAIAVDIAILFLSVLSHNASPFQRMTSVFTLPIDAAELRRGILGITREDPNFFSNFNHSLAIHRGRYYLVASPDVPELYGSISNTIIMLHAAGLGQITQARDPAFNRLSASQREAFLEALLAPLVATSRLFGRGGRVSDTGLQAMELPPRVVQAIHLLLCLQPETTAASESAPPNPAGNGGPGGPGGADDPGGPAGFGPHHAAADDWHEPGPMPGPEPADDPVPEDDVHPDPARAAGAQAPEPQAEAARDEDPEAPPPDATPTVGE